MKRLAVLRHAKSSWDDPHLEDFDRPLNDRGWKAARRVGEEMKRRGLRFDLVLASPAARVRETLDGVGEMFGSAAPVRFDPRIYLANAEVLLSIVRDFPQEVRRPLLVGHNPGLERLLLELTGDHGNALRAQVGHKFPTGALAVIELPASRWAEFEGGGGKILELILPNELD